MYKVCVVQLYIMNRTKIFYLILCDWQKTNKSNNLRYSEHQRYSHRNNLITRERMVWKKFTYRLHSLMVKVSVLFLLLKQAFNSQVIILVHQLFALLYVTLCEFYNSESTDARNYSLVQFVSRRVANFSHFP